MNQALQFSEDESFDSELQAVLFSAFQNGFRLVCAIGESETHRCFGEGQPLELFRANRWDIEEEAEKIIASQQDDHQGIYWIWFK